MKSPLKVRIFSIIGIAALLLGCWPGALLAQAPPEGEGQFALPRLSGPQKSTLLLIAREAVDAALEGRASREATVDARLQMPQPLVISIYVDGKLRSRAWRLKPAQPLYIDARSVTEEAIDEPRDGGAPLGADELARAKIGLAVLSGYMRVADDRGVPPRSAVVVLSGFTEALGLPGDVKSNAAADLLTFACERAGLRPNIWLLPQTAVFYAQADGTQER
ncbi:MAG: hypothetical protein LBV79_02765 [Candidatus Adiutrix sp.]|jgi:AMMECR1 domain-containing protein|nr:hypothetical protein [Candidatus Adiutrix sp.]